MDDRMGGNEVQGKNVLHGQVQPVLHVVHGPGVNQHLLLNPAGQPAQKIAVVERGGAHRVAPAELGIPGHDILQVGCAGTPVADDKDRRFLNFMPADRQRKNQRLQQRRQRQKQRGPQHV